MNEQVKSALLSCTQNVFLYTATGNKEIHYGIYGNDGESAFHAGGKQVERADQGTIDLYTKKANDELVRKIPAALNAVGIAFYLNSIQYEEETDGGLLHYEWVYEAV